MKTGFEINFSCLECEQRLVLTQLKKHPFPHRKLINFLISFNNYENKILSDLIIKGKTEGIFEIFIDFGIYISNEMKNCNLKNYFLVPVPITSKKLIQRGFNQSEVLAQTISKKLGLKIYHDLHKIKETPDQNELAYEKRLKNLKNSFKTTSQAPAYAILIDDIKTTGTTLKECALALRSSGTKKIIALTILR